MSDLNPTHYDVLGVPRNANTADLTRALNRFRAEMAKETTAPDHRRCVLIKKAFEVLSDPDRRDEYDASLVAPDRKRLARQAGIGGGVLALAAVAAYFALRPAAPAVQPARNPQDIAYWASASVGRVQKIEMSGQTEPLGLAFAVEEGVMVTSCHGLAPDSQIFVHFKPRALPARVVMASEELGLCKLAVAGVGSWPLPVSGAAAQVGDKVYTARMGPSGEVTLADGTVKRVVPDAKGQVIETTLPMPPGDGGAPLLDIYGRVIAIAQPLQAGGAPGFVVAPAQWIVDTRPVRPAPAPVPASVAPQDGKDAVKVSPDRRQKLQEAFRPPPQVPDDL